MINYIILLVLKKERHVCQKICNHVKPNASLHIMFLNHTDCHLGIIYVSLRRRRPHPKLGKHLQVVPNLLGAHPAMQCIEGHPVGAGVVVVVVVVGSGRSFPDRIFLNSSLSASVISLMIVWRKAHL